MDIRNQRLEGETQEQYRARQRANAVAIRAYLRGQHAARAKDGRTYEQGPHPSHRPKAIEKEIDGEKVVVGLAHRGTLVKPERRKSATPVTVERRRVKK